MTPDAVDSKAAVTPAVDSPAAATPAKNERPWDKSYPAGIRWDAEVPVTTMVQMFRESVEKFGDKPCLDFLGKKLTYNEVDAASDRFAKSLQDQGIGKGNHVGLCLPDTPFHVIAYYGALKAGATIVNFNPLYAEKEMKHLIEDSECDLMVTFNNKQLVAKVDKALNGEGGTKKIVVCDIAEALPAGKRILLRAQTVAKTLAGKLDGALDKKLGKLPPPPDKKANKDTTAPKPGRVARARYALKKFAKVDTVKAVNDATHITFSKMLSSAGAPSPVALTPDDIAVLQYTGGTTGVPKAVMLTHGNLTANIAQSEMWFTAGADKTKGPGKMLAVLPFFHVFAMTVQENLSLKLGAELFMLPIPETEKMLKTIDKVKPTMFAAVPSMYQSMQDFKAPKKGKLATLFNAVAHPFGRKGYDLSSVELWLSGGAATPDTLEKSWKEHTGKPFTKGYGLSETSPLVIADPLYGTRKEGSIGLPVPGTEVRIVHLENPDAECPLGTDGEICIRGPQVMKGYWKHDDETAKVMDKDGFFHTGDTGYIDEDGYIFVTGRLKDMINRQGLKVFPLKVEGAILQHPSVSEVAVVGVADPKVGEEVKGHIVFKPGKDVKPEELKKFLGDKLAPYEIPHLWKFRESLPKTAIGKPDKKALKAEDAAAAEKAAAAPQAPKTP